MQVFQRRGLLLCGRALLSLSALLLLFAHGAQAQTYDYRLGNVFGPSSVYAGSNVYIQLEPLATSGGTSAIPVYFTAVQLSGAPVSFAVVCRINNCPVKNGVTYQNIYNTGGFQVIVRASIPASTQPGRYTLVITTVSGSLTRSLSRTLNVLSPPAAPPASPFLPSLPVPTVAKWRDTMLRLGTKWCNPTATYAFGDSSQVWYYDGARVFYQIADETGDPSWNACAVNIARQYRDYILNAGGNVPSWRLFTRGLRMAYERTGDPTYKQAIVAAASLGYVRYQLAVSDERIRENAYALNSLVDAELAGEPRSPHLTRLADYLIGHYDQLFVSKQYTIHQTFYDGLAAEALIGYYELTRDPRIPPTIKLMLDWLWDYGWNKSTFKMVYNPDPAGPTCSELCRVYLTDLINLVVPAYAWYWRTTGDIVYQQRGDEIFSHALDTDISWNGKIFSQNYRWSFDYIRWRTVDEPCKYNVTVSAVQVPAAGSTVTAQVVPSRQDCAWSASSDAAWAVSSNSGTLTGSGSASFVLAPNTTAVGRTASLKIAGETFTISQAAAAPAAVVQGLLLSPAIVKGAATTTQNSVTLAAPAGPAGVAVALSSNNPAVVVPAQVVIPAGLTSAVFPVKTTAVPFVTAAAITASSGASLKTAALTINPPVLSSISFGAVSVAGGLPVTVYVRLDSPAPAGGIVLAIASTNRAAAMPPASASVPAGATSATFSLPTQPVTVATQVSISASFSGVTKAAVLQVQPASVSGINLQRTTTSGGVVLNWNTVGLTGPAPAGGVVVALSSSNPLAVVPPSVTVPAGARTAPFSITVAPVTAATTATITAKQGGKSVAATISMTP